MVMGVETTTPERVTVCNFVKNNYSTLNQDEIIIAFDLAYAGKFNLAINERPNRISARYMGAILSAYEKYKAVEMKGVDYGFMQIPQMSESELEKKNREAIIFFYKRHCENEKNKLNDDYKELYYPGSVCYDWLTTHGIELRSPVEITPHEIKDRRQALEIHADALTISKTEIVKEYFTALNKKK